MAIIQRRIFHAKVGAADPLLAVLREGNQTFESMGFSGKLRLLTDYMSGRSDRVVEEIEANSIGEMEEVFGKVMSNSEVMEKLNALEKRIFELIEYSEVEYWTIH